MADGVRFIYSQDVLTKGYIQACNALRTCKYGNFPFIEIVLPPDARASEQSDAVPKAKKFREALKDQGINAPVRVLPSTSDKLMDIDMVTAMMHKIYMHSVDAAPLRNALFNFKRKWDKTNECWQGEPAKSKYNDLCDTARYAVTDYVNKHYRVALTPGVNKNRGQVNGDMQQWVNVGAHPTQGSVCLNPDGTILGHNMDRGQEYGQKRIFFQPG